MKYMQKLPPEPEQPDEKDWGFINLLQEPLHKPFKWRRESASSGEASFKGGISLLNGFPDGEGLLDTAVEDFTKFLRMGGIPLNGKYPVRIKKIKTGVFEEYVISVKKNGLEISAGDTEGIRRALVYLEDELMRSGGPFLRPGRIKRRPVIKTRVTRCCYGPINRPPKNRDELDDDIDYYPDEYLNRLAHDGVNGLWLTIVFRDTIPSKIIPEYGRNAEKRLKKLSSVAAKCRRYGIKIYPFCIEPSAFADKRPDHYPPLSILERHPELKGHSVPGCTRFCTMSPLGQAYLEEATYTLFSRIPHLGGLINISVGERATNCYSSSIVNNNCPRCSKKKPEEVLSAMLSAMARGMHKASPGAQMISWHYSQYICWGEKATEKAAGDIPEGVALQLNFESAGRAKQLGKLQYAGDYWLSYIGPSRLFSNCCKRAVAAGTPVFAKIQVSCSHEVATVPWVSVPGNLYRKYRRMHRLGVSGVTQCWYFGAYPGLMSKAAGELSFAPLPASEDAFLKKLAASYMDADADSTVDAWHHFQRAYNMYPLNAIFGYYGPMHDGPVWPLYLKPQNKPLSPTWKLEYPPSGDRIGESFTYTHTLPEILKLCGGISENWDKGVKILQKAGRKNAGNLRVDEALGLQFKSGYNIMKFYDLREKMFDMPGPERLDVLRQMEDIVRKEIDVDKRLLELSVLDPRLGFHAEAEGYKYFPERISWRMKHLEKVLKADFPFAAAEIKAGKQLFPAYTGSEPDAPVYQCRYISRPPDMKKDAFADPVWEKLPEQKLDCWRDIDTDTGPRPYAQGLFQKYQTKWKAACDHKALYFRILCRTPYMEALKGGKTGDLTCREEIELRIEPKRLFPPCSFSVNADGIRGYNDYTNNKNFQWSASVFYQPDAWSAVLRIPYTSIHHKNDRYRLNIIRSIHLPSKDKDGRSIFNEHKNRWIDMHPLTSRLIFGIENPALDFGWLVLHK